VSYERQPIADHAINLASTIQLNLKRSLEALGVVGTLWPLLLCVQLPHKSCQCQPAHVGMRRDSACLYKQNMSPPL
jgi:hypothetical protein